MTEADFARAWQITRDMIDKAIEKGKTSRTEDDQAAFNAIRYALDMLADHVTELYQRATID